MIRSFARSSAFVGSLGSCLVIGAALSACGSSRDSFEGAPPDAGAPTFSNDDAGEEPVDDYKCVDEEVTRGEPVPLSLVILLDRSGSMQGDRWTSATNAIRAFVDRSEVVGMKVGLQFFPPVAGDQCVAATYANLSVPIDVLPDNVLPIQQRLANTSPNGGTPMGAALDGTIGAMQRWLAEAEPHAGAVILVTDGDPAGCGGGIDAVASVAASGVDPTGDGPSVRTFAVGMEGATFANLDKVAVAGGGHPKAFNVGGGVSAQQALLEALETIRTGVISCEYLLPTPKRTDGVLDLDSVELTFTPGQNDPPTSVRRVDSKEACGATTGGFYYDDPKKPQSITLCPATCEAVRKAPPEDSRMDVVLGCIQIPS